MADELLTRDRMLALGEPLEVFLPDLATETPLTGELSMPRAANQLAFAVVVLARVLKFVGVIAARLSRWERGSRSSRGGRCERTE